MSAAGGFSTDRNAFAFHAIELGRHLVKTAGGLSFALLAATAAKAEQVLELRPDWEFVADGVMGGVSTGGIARDATDGRDAMRLRGMVSLENNGGFVQMAFDPGQGGRPFDASGWSGLAIDVRGNGERYELRLRTDQLSRPWQSFRAEFTAPQDWATLSFPFSAFKPHRTDVVFAPARLRRIGILAIGRVFEADISVAGLRLVGDGEAGQ